MDNKTKFFSELLETEARHFAHVAKKYRDSECSEDQAKELLDSIIDVILVFDMFDEYSDGKFSNFYPEDKGYEMIEKKREDIETLYQNVKHLIDKKRNIV
jgi:hypothetical protein